MFSFVRNTFKLQSIAENEYQSLLNQRIDILISKSQPINEENEYLNFPLEKNGLLKLKNDTAQKYIADYLLFEYLGFLDIFNVYVLNVTTFSDNQIWFINKANGNITKTLRFYNLSNRYIISYDLPECDRYDGIEIFCNRKKGLQKIDAFKPNWVIDDLFSLNEDIFIVKAHPINDSEKSLFFKIQIKE